MIFSNKTPYYTLIFVFTSCLLAFFVWRGSKKDSFQKASMKKVKVAIIKQGKIFNVFVPENFSPLFKSNQASKTYNERIQFLKRQGHSLSREERNGLYEFLNSDENDKLTLHVKDEIMCLLESQKKRPSEFIDKLIEISQDNNLDSDLRGYALQHLRYAYEKAGKDPEKEKIRNAFYEALKDRESIVCGTSMLALAALSEEDKSFDNKRIEEAALELVSDPSLHVPSKVSVVRICGNLNLKSSLPTIRSLAKSTENKMIKLAALASLGDIGGMEDFAFLSQMRKKKFYKKAAELSINKIKQRNQVVRSY